MTKRLIIFTKLPRPGQVKTRLIPVLGKANAAELYHRLLTHTLDTHSKQDTYELELCCASDIDHPLFDELQREYSCHLSLQKGEDLGQRMHHACQQALTRRQQVIVIGCDCPLLSVTDVQQGFDRLEHSDDLVLGPAEDGGYVMIGMSSPHKGIFEAIDWGSDQVYQQTIDRVHHLGLSHSNIATHWDLDLPQDLDRLRSHGQLTSLMDDLWPEHPATHQIQQ